MAGLAAALLLLGLLGYWLATVLLRVETANGTLLVEMNDDEVEARIKNGKLILSGPDGKVRYTLTPNDRSKKLDAGPYTIRVEGAGGLALDTPEFTMKKGGEVKVRVTLESTAMGKKNPPGKPELPKTVTVDLGGNIKMEFVLIPKGKFKMGSPQEERGRNPFEKEFDAEALHDVKLTRPFYMAKYLVTQEQYEAVAGKNPSLCTRERLKKDTKRHPVDTISWDDAKSYCEIDCKRQRKAAHSAYRTDAEWE